MAPTHHRYAAYFAPAVDSPWWQAGSAWLGRCAARQQALAQPPVPGVPAAEQQRLTAAPRRYGWHATLKAPFALAPEVDLTTLRAGLREVCRSLQPFDLPRLQVTRLDDFLALVPAGESRALHAVEQACVAGLQPLAAPLSHAELQRRRAAGLTPEEDALLLRWGYPYVMERFRFHFSLTGALPGVPEPVVQALHQAATHWFAPLPPCRMDAVALFAEPHPGADFVLLERVELGA